MFTIAAGIVAGKEGPFVHAGGLVGGGLSQFAISSSSWINSKTGIDFGVTNFRSDKAKRDFVAIGTATGVAVAFGAPVGGMLFTLEEGASYYNAQILMRSFLSTCVGGNEGKQQTHSRDYTRNNSNDYIKIYHDI